jgi:hypothetical protein
LGVVSSHFICTCFLWRVAAAKYKTAAGWVGLGLGSYWIFGLAEFFRVSFALNAITPWRARLLNEPNPEMGRLLKENLLSWPQINNALFFLLVLVSY